MTTTVTGVFSDTPNYFANKKVADPAALTKPAQPASEPAVTAAPAPAAPAQKAAAVAQATIPAVITANPLNASPVGVAPAASVAQKTVAPANTEQKAPVAAEKPAQPISANPVDATRPSIGSRITTAVSDKAKAVKDKTVEVASNAKQAIKDGAVSFLNTDDQNDRAARAVASLTKLGTTLASSPESAKVEDGEMPWTYAKRLFEKYSETAPDAGRVRKALGIAKGAILTSLALPGKISGVVGDAVFKVLNNSSLVIGPAGSALAALISVVARVATFAIAMVIAVAGIVAAVAIVAIASVAVPVAGVLAPIAVLPVLFIANQLGILITIALVKIQKLGQELKASREETKAANERAIAAEARAQAAEEAAKADREQARLDREELKKAMEAQQASFQVALQQATNEIKLANAPKAVEPAEVVTEPAKTGSKWSDVFSLFSLVSA